METWMLLESTIRKVMQKLTAAGEDVDMVTRHAGPRSPRGLSPAPAIPPLDIRPQFSFCNERL